MATPTVTKSKSRVLGKCLAILLRGNTGGATTARTYADENGGASIKNTVKRVWVCAGAPTAGTGAADGDICLDTTNSDVYRYATIGTDAWYKINVTA